MLRSLCFRRSASITTIIEIDALAHPRPRHRARLALAPRRGPPAPPAEPRRAAGTAKGHGNRFGLPFGVQARLLDRSSPGALCRILLPLRAHRASQPHSHASEVMTSEKPAKRRAQAALGRTRPSVRSRRAARWKRLLPHWLVSVRECTFCATKWRFSTLVSRRRSLTPHRHRGTARTP